MARIAVIDEDIRGWVDEHMEELKKRYVEIKKAGINGDLPELTTDQLIAAYCKSNNCDLFTADKKSYTSYFDSTLRVVEISEYARWETGKKSIFLIKSML